MGTHLEDIRNSRLLKIVIPILLLLAAQSHPVWGQENYARVSISPIPVPPGPPTPDVVATAHIPGTLVAVGSGTGASGVDHLIAASTEGKIYSLGHSGEIEAQVTLPGNPVALWVRRVMPPFIYAATLQGGIYRLSGSMGI